MSAVGGSVPRGTAMLTEKEMEQSASTQVARASIGIVPDSIELAWSQLGMMSLWKYLSTSANPSLVAPLINLRTSLLTKESSWTEEFNRLLDLLPEHIKARLLLESRLPPEERNSSFAAFDTLLGGIARANVWLRARMLDATESPMPTQTNDVLMYAARQGVIAHGNAILQAARSLLDQAGHNLGYYDELSQLISQMQDAANDIEALNQPSALTPENKTSLTRIASYLDSLSQQLQARFVGDNLLILKPMLEAMSLVTAASVMETGSAYLLIGLSTANVGIDRTDSALGILPKLLGSLRDKISEALSGSLLPKADIGSKRLLPLLVTASFVAAMGFMDLVNPNIAKGNFPLQLALNFALHFGLLKGISSGIARACGADDKTQSLGGHILTCTTVLLMIHAVHAKNGNLAAPLIEAMRSDLTSWFNEINQYATETLQYQGISNPQASAAAILIQQARIALEASDYDTALQIFLDAPKVIQGQDEENDAFKTFYDEIARISSSRSKQGDTNFNEALTGITQV